jgi:hypothetical protein
MVMDIAATTTAKISGITIAITTGSGGLERTGGGAMVRRGEPPGR